MVGALSCAEDSSPIKSRRLRVRPEGSISSIVKMLNVNLRLFDYVR